MRLEHLFEPSSNIRGSLSIISKYLFIYSINTTAENCYIQLPFIQPWCDTNILYINNIDFLIVFEIQFSVLSQGCVHFTHSATVEPVFFPSPWFILWTIKSIAVHIYCKELLHLFTMSFMSQLNGHFPCFMLSVKM